MDQIQKHITPLIENQFPEFYRTEGPIFVEFIKQYYKWLEESQSVSQKDFAGTGHVHVNSKNTIVTGIGTNFTQIFANGDEIAIYYDSDLNTYDVFTIDAVTNSTYLTLTSNNLPTFTSGNSWYTSVFTQYNPNYYLRRFDESNDIDNTVDSFLVYFKEKYLKNIQYDTAFNIRYLLKHSLNLYRSKGTERSLDLLFRSVFGLPASVYYPSVDIFRLSDGKWFTPTYLEISMERNSDKLVGKQIVGDTSGALAFVEALIRRSVKGRLIDVLFISALKGNFSIGESINTIDEILEQRERPYLIGSLTSFDVSADGSGANYEEGDLVDIYSNYGDQGIGRVTEIIDATGRVTFTLTNGGYAYRETANVLISENVLAITNLVYSAPPARYASFLEGIVQPTSTIEYYDVSETFVVANNDYLYTYHVNNDVKGIGLVIDYTASSNTLGTIKVNVLFGDMDDATYYTEANALSATQNTYTAETYQANVIGYHANVSVTANVQSGTFVTDEELYQVDSYGLFVANGSISYIGSLSGSKKTFNVSNLKGAFTPDYLVRGRTSNATATLLEQTIYMGVINSTNTLYSNPNNYVYFANSLATATIDNISTGTLANVSFSNSLLYTETFDINDDYILPYVGTYLNASQYDFPDYPSGNLTNGTLAQMLANTTYTIGKIQQLTGINQGQDYNIAPVIKVWDQITSGAAKKDYVLEIANVSGYFSVGEIVSQTDSSSRGLVKSVNTSHMYVEQLRYLDENNFTLTSNSTTVLTGEKSGATANVTNFYPDNATESLGLNAVLDADVRTVSGSVTKLEVYNSGFGYKEGETVRFVKQGEGYDSNTAGFAFSTLQRQGYGESYYKEKGGLLSDQKKLFDGIYYQEYCIDPDSLVLTADLRWVEAKTLKENDDIIGFDENLNGKIYLKPSKVMKSDIIKTKKYKVITDKGESTVSENHMFVQYMKKTKKQSTYKWTLAKELNVGDQLTFACNPWKEKTDFDSGWLSGILDGEGWCSAKAGNCGVAQNQGPVLEKIKHMFNESEIRYCLTKQRKSSNCHTLTTMGIWESMKLIGMFRPIRLLEKADGLWDGRTIYRKDKKAHIATITEIVELEEGDVVTMATSTKTLIVDGFLSHNSYEVRSSITLNKYEEMLKKLLHVSGTKYFGALVYNTELTCNVACQSTTITVGA